MSASSRGEPRRLPIRRRTRSPRRRSAGSRRTLIGRPGRPAGPAGGGGGGGGGGRGGGGAAGGGVGAAVGVAAGGADDLVAAASGPLASARTPAASRSAFRCAE